MLKEKKIFKTLKIGEIAYNTLKEISEREGMKMTIIIEKLLEEKIEIKDNAINKRS